MTDARAVESSARLSSRQKALAGFAALVTETPWLVRASDLDRLRAVGLSDDGVLQATAIAAWFNYLTRVADATGIEFDYESPLPRISVDKERDPVPRPDPSEWPRLDPAPALSVAERPALATALERWERYVFEREAPLSRRDRALLGRTAAWHLCDAAGVEERSALLPATRREAALVTFSTKLTQAPWQMRPRELDALRAHGLDDRALLDAIATVALQNVLSRLRMTLAAPR